MRSSALIGRTLLCLLIGGPVSAQVTAIDTTAATRSAERATRDWLGLVDKGQIAESWKQSAALFKLAVTQPAWEQAVSQARGSFEPFGARDRIAATFTTQLPGTPIGQYVVFQYRTVVTGGHVVETVTPMLDPDGVWRVSGYFVRPD